MNNLLAHFTLTSFIWSFVVPLPNVTNEIAVFEVILSTKCFVVTSAAFFHFGLIS
jgi:hypothetical protein